MTVQYGQFLKSGRQFVKPSRKKRMAPPNLQAKRDLRRDRILDVARECFLRDGYAGCSMALIAARLGGSKGTLYNYFPSKESLFDAFVRRACDRVADALMSSPEAPEDWRERLTYMARTFLQHLLSPDAIAVQRLVVGESERFPELGRLFYEVGPARGLARIRAEVCALMDAGHIRRADPQIAAFHFKDLVLSGLQSLRLWGVIPDPSPAEIEAQARLGVETFLRAYAPD